MDDFSPHQDPHCPPLNEQEQAFMVLYNLRPLRIYSGSVTCSKRIHDSDDSSRVMFIRLDRTLPTTDWYLYLKKQGML